MAKNPRLVYVSELIQQLASSQGDAHPTPYTRILYNIEEGTVILNPSETIQHSAVLDRLIRDFGKAEDISPSAIEQALNWAILFALDTREKRQDLSLEQRIKIATNELQQKLTQPATYHECYIPIGGIDPQSLPWRFGLVTFLLFNESQIAKFRRAIRKHLVSDEQMSVRQIVIGDMKKYNIWNSPCARVRVKAKEPRAAITLASKHVRITIDCINFWAIPFRTTLDGCISPEKLRLCQYGRLFSAKMVLFCFRVSGKALNNIFYRETERYRISTVICAKNRWLAENEPT
jgi:hypothetical protein